MTREEAKEILQGAIKKPNTKDGYLGQAIDMAIKALEQEPCEDAVSRQQTISTIRNLYPSTPFVRLNLEKWQEENKKYFECENIIKALPSVTPIHRETVTDFADRCKECGREKVLDKIRAEIEQSYCETNNDYDHGRNYGLYMATQIIDKYTAESEEKK